MKILYFIAFYCLIFLCVVNAEIEKRAIREDRFCLFHSDCQPYQYCMERSKRWSICSTRSADGAFCMFDSSCQSGLIQILYNYLKDLSFNYHNHNLLGHCHRFKCTGIPKSNPNARENDRCEKDDDCLVRQYCHKKKCQDRQESGSCSSDSQCMSGYCYLFRCHKLRQYYLDLVNNQNKNEQKVGFDQL